MLNLTPRQRVLRAYLQALVDCAAFSPLPAFARCSVFNDPELADMAKLRLF